MSYLIKYRSLFQLLTILATWIITWSFSAPAKADAILHAFDWNYQTVADRAEEIADTGYKAVLVAPPLKSGSECVWYKRYQPEDFRVIDHCRGNKEQFVNMINQLEQEGVQTYADIVVNHMANERGNSTSFPGDEALNDYRSNSEYWERQKLYGDLNNGLFSSNDFNSEFCIKNYQNKDEVINGRICGQSPDRGLPDLRSSEWVNNQRKQYIQTLYDLGVRGFRLDAAKHMRLDTIKTIIPDSIADNAQIFAETITSGGVGNQEYQLYLEPYLRELSASFGAYDFPLLNVIKNSFSPSGQLSNLADPYGNGNALENTRAITVVVTHDIPYNDGFRYLILDPRDEQLAYAYLMGRDGGSPLVLDDGSDGKIDNGRWVDAWKDPWIKSTLVFHNRMQGKGMEILHADQCSLLWRREEDGIVGINKCGFDQQIPVNTDSKFKWNRDYRDALGSNDIVNINSSNYTFTIPARQARMWYVD